MKVLRRIEAGKLKCKVMKQMNRIKFSLLGTAMMLLSITSFGQSGTTGPLTWSLSSGTLTISGSGVMPNYSFPNYAPWYSYVNSITNVVIGNNVTSIGDYAFWNCHGLTSVTIPDSITSIGEMAFAYCYNLQIVNYNAINCTTTVGINLPVFYKDTAFKTLNIGNNVKNIPNDAFKSCSGLTSVAIPNGVISIESMAFYDCSNLTSVIIPNSITSIGQSAFSGCSSLISVTIPENTTSIGSNTFLNCTSLQTVNYNAINCTTVNILPGPTPTPPVFGNCYAVSTLIIGNMVNSIPNLAFVSERAVTGQYSCFFDTIISYVTNAPTLLFQCFGSNCYEYPSNPICNIPVYIPCGSLSSYINNWGGSYSYNFNFISTNDSTFYTAVKCYNVPYSDNNFTNLTQTGNHFKTFQSANGCDSVVCLTLTENPPIPVTNYSASFYQGDTYADNNFSNITQAGDYYVTLKNVNGCDSVICLSLTANIRSVTNIANVPAIATANVPLTLTGTVVPSNASNQNIVWSLIYAGTTNASVISGVLYTSASGTAVVKATIVNGIATGTDYTQDFNIEVNAGSSFISVTEITNVPTTAIAGTPLTLTGIVLPTTATNQNIVWSVKDAGTTGATISGNTFTAATAGAAIITATITNGLAEGTNRNYIQDFSIVVGGVGIAEISQSAGLRIYPNPTKNSFFVENENGNTIKLYDMSGKEVLTQNINGKTEIDIDINHLPSGIYNVCVFSKEKIVGNGKIVKE